MSDPAVSKSILLVEDDDAIRTDLSFILTSEGYSVVAKENGQKALEYLTGRELRPDLILLDVMMPVMDGWQFRQAQIQVPEFASIPLVVMTADGHAPQKAALMSAQGFVQKPIDLDHLLDVVAQCSSESRLG
jgi:CheY-like chemotaxis protein